MLLRLLKLFQHQSVHLACHQSSVCRRYIDAGVHKSKDQGLNQSEGRQALVNQQCLVYHFKCDLCFAGCVGYVKVRIKTNLV